MLTLEIDGQSVEVQDGSTVMEAAQKLGLYVPHFCYHKKLSIAANCRMCLVEVEKAPKPLPACATPVTQGMKVKTDSPAAKQAQKGVMELLLINHPLDCPICDQGGECQLQDLAVGYGGSHSRYDEPKRVVFNKNLGPLISTDMTRCIHCTRCVRFGQEVAGVMELGMANRGEHSEIMSFVGHTVDSELSGNMIDLCPVGALTSKPFRYTARTWELARRRTVSPHDSLGSNLIVQTKHNQVMRVVPFENEAINECWLSDRDRFSYEGLNSEERLGVPMVKREGTWEEATWEEAIVFASEALQRIRSAYGAERIGILASSSSTCEELYTGRLLAEALDTANLDTRLRRSDFSLDAAQQGAFYLGQAIADLDHMSAVWVVGADLRADHPLMAQRLRKATKRGAKIAALMPFSPEWLMPLEHEWIITFDAATARLERWLLALDKDDVATSLPDVERTQLEFLKAHHPTVLIGNLALNHPGFGNLYAALVRLADRVGLKLGFLGDAANSVGAHWVGAHPQGTLLEYRGLNAKDMFYQALKAYVLVGLDPDLDTYDAAAALKALKTAESVVALTSYKTKTLLEHAQILLPMAPFTETRGSFVNIEGLQQHFHAVATPFQKTLPGWKILMALLQSIAPDDSQISVTIETLQNKMTHALPAIGTILNNEIALDKMSRSVPMQLSEGNWVRIGEILPYSTDAIVRHAPSLQKREVKKHQRVGLRPEDGAALGISEGGYVNVRQSGSVLRLPVYFDGSLPAKAVRLSHVHVLGGLMDPIEVEKS